MNKMTVKSVYNFVPAPTEDQVFKPDWANRVSHDIPFSDGESGEIEFTIKAETPIFIRNGHTREDSKKKTDRFLEFSHVVRNGQKQYFIPGSSLKGMIRNVFEIISGSRLGQLDNHRHAVRQIMKTKGTIADEGYELTKDKKNIRAGWLIFQNGKYYIYDCGKPYKIRYTDIDKKLGTKFGEYFIKGGKAKIEENFSHRTAAYKYRNIIRNQNLEYLFEEHPLNETDKQKSWVSRFQPLPYVRFATTDTEETFWGNIVCAGQASNYDVKTSRKGEYVFKGKKSDLINDENKKINVPEEKYEDFLFINRHNQPDELEDWKYFKKQIEKGIPVFFRLKPRNNKNNKEVLDFGLTFMYKQPASYSVHEMAPVAIKTNGPLYTRELDLAETIFGTTKKGRELKGRVMFSHALSVKNDVATDKIEVLLSTPRSSYYPFYIKQNGNNGKVTAFNTYNSNRPSVLSGFKRYPVHQTVKKQDLLNMNDEMKTIIRPLKEGAEFVGKLRFHNLRPIEIGALLSAITFHNNKGYHSLGYGKPLGYGKVSISINKFSLVNKEQQLEMIEFMKTFEFEMRKFNKNWSMEELMATTIENTTDELLEYMELNSFQEVKNEGKFLEPYKNPNLVFKTFYTIEEIIRLENEAREKLDKIVKKAEQHFVNKEWQLAKSKYMEAIDLAKNFSNYIEDLKLKITECDDHIKRDKELEPLRNLTDKADELYGKEKWEDAKNLYDKAIELAEKLTIDNSDIRAKKNKCIEKLRLSKSSLDRLKEISTYDEGRKVLHDYVKAGKALSDQDIKLIKEFIFRCYDKLSQKEKNKWRSKYKKEPWSFLRKCVKDKTVRQWFDELTNKK